MEMAAPHSFAPNMCVRACAFACVCLTYTSQSINQFDGEISMSLRSVRIR